MASGTPCIVSKNCGCYLDLIEEAQTGWGFDPNNAIELSSLFLKVEKMNQMELSKMRKNIKSKINKFDLDNFKLAVDEAIENSLNNRKSSLISSILAYVLFKIKGQLKLIKNDSKNKSFIFIRFLYGFPINF